MTLSFPPSIPIQHLSSLASLSLVFSTLQEAKTIHGYILHNNVTQMSDLITTCMCNVADAIVVLSLSVCGYYFQETGNQLGVGIKPSSWSLELGSAVQCRVSLFILHAHTKPGADVWDSFRPSDIPLCFPYEVSYTIESVPSSPGYAITFRGRSPLRTRRNGPHGSATSGYYIFTHGQMNICKLMFCRVQVRSIG